MLNALADGETNRAALAALAHDRLRATPEQLCDALGACTELKPVYRRLLKMTLEHLQTLEQQIGQLDQELATLLHSHQDAVGLEGVLNESSDGLLFLDLGFRQDSPTQGGHSLPGRGAISIRWRAPYWLMPGDIVVDAPILAFTSPQKLQKLAVKAANGGLIPWQAGINTRVGRFQFMLGREMGLGLYGYNDGQQVFVPTPGIAPLNTTLIRLRSIRVDVPFFRVALVSQIFNGPEFRHGGSISSRARYSDGCVHRTARGCPQTAPSHGRYWRSARRV